MSVRSPIIASGHLITPADWAESDVLERLDTELNNFAERVHALLAQGSPGGEMFNDLSQLALRDAFSQLLLHIMTGISLFTSIILC